MRVLVLEHPRLPSSAHFNDIANTPLWSCLMAGYACASLERAGAEVEILDARRWSFQRCEQHILDDPPELLAVHAVYFWENTHTLFESLQRLKERGLQAPICVFGFFPSLCWQEMLTTYGCIDLVAVGEPELTLAELASGADPRNVAGLALAGPGGAQLNRPRPPLKDLGALPHPLRPGLRFEATVSILASRGCYNACSFCLIPALHGGNNLWRPRPVADIIGEVKHLRSQDKREFYFVDPNFIGPGKAGRQRTLQLARALAPLGIGFGLETRAGDLRPELMAALKEAGLNSMLLGLESASPAALKRMNKNILPKANLTAIEIARRAGVEPEVGFMMFEARGSLQEVAENFAFLQRANLLDRLSRTANLLCHQQIALKGTPLYAQSTREGRLTPSGVLGFEGKLSFDDHRLAWLAQVTQAMCLRVLRESSRPDSPLFWQNEKPGREPYLWFNDLLLEQFARMLKLAHGLGSEPDAAWTAGLLDEVMAQIESLIQRAQDGDFPAQVAAQPIMES
jgi:5-methoxy-6-methylbenzimidazole methyltransferase